MMKIYSVKYADIIVGLVDKLVEIFKANSNVMEHERQKLLARHLMFTEYFFKIAFAIYFITCIIFSVFPIVSYIVLGEMVIIDTLYLPGIDENSLTGYIILSIFHLNCVWFSALGSSGVDFIFSILILNVPVIANIIGDNIRDLNELLNEMRPKLVMIKAKLRNILIQYYEYRQ